MRSEYKLKSGQVRAVATWRKTAWYLTTTDGNTGITRVCKFPLSPDVRGMLEFMHGKDLPEGIPLLMKMEHEEL